MYDGEELPNVGFNAVVGRPVDEYSFEPVRFDQMRRGAWDIDARIADMDINGVYASVNFPSFLPGFAGQRLQNVTNDVDLAMATVRAWNDWHIDAWAGAYPDRIIPSQIPWLLDADVGADMIRENAVRGFKAVTFPESPIGHGLPSIHSGLLGPVHRRVRRDRAPSSTCTSGRRARHRPRVTTPRPTSPASCSSGTRCSPRSTGSTRCTPASTRT